MFEKLEQMLKENYGISNIEPDMKFKTDLGLSSFDFITLLCFVENEYGIELEEDKYHTFNTVEDLVKYLEQLIAGKNEA